MCLINDQRFPAVFAVSHHTQFAIKIEKLKDVGPTKSEYKVRWQLCTYTHRSLSCFLRLILVDCNCD